MQSSVRSNPSDTPGCGFLGRFAAGTLIAKGKPGAFLSGQVPERALQLPPERFREVDLLFWRLETAARRSFERFECCDERPGYVRRAKGFPCGEMDGSGGNPLTPKTLVRRMGKWLPGRNSESEQWVAEAALGKAVFSPVVLAHLWQSHLGGAGARGVGASSPDTPFALTSRFSSL